MWYKNILFKVKRRSWGCSIPAYLRLPQQNTAMYVHQDHIATSVCVVYGVYRCVDCWKDRNIRYRLIMILIIIVITAQVSKLLRIHHTLCLCMKSTIYRFRSATATKWTNEDLFQFASFNNSRMTCVPCESLWNAAIVSNSGSRRGHHFISSQSDQWESLSTCILHIVSMRPTDLGLLNSGPTCAGARCTICRKWNQIEMTNCNSMQYKYEFCVCTLLVSSFRRRE